MKITFFVANSASTSAKPGDTTNNLRMHLPPASDKVDDQNLAVFPEQNRKSAIIEIQGLDEAQLAKFKGGKRVVVTFEVEK